MAKKAAPKTKTGGGTTPKAGSGGKPPRPPKPKGTTLTIQGGGTTARIPGADLGGGTTVRIPGPCETTLNIIEDKSGNIKINLTEL